jgi:hypothetical protein
MPALKNFIAPQSSTSAGSIVLIRLHVEHFWSTPNSRSLDEPAFRRYGLEVEMALATTHRLALENTSVTGLGAPAVPRAAYPDLIATDGIRYVMGGCALYDSALHPNYPCFYKCILNWIDSSLVLIVVF